LTANRESGILEIPDVYIRYLNECVGSQSVLRRTITMATMRTTNAISRIMRIRRPGRGMPLGRSTLLVAVLALTIAACAGETASTTTTEAAPDTSAPPAETTTTEPATTSTAAPVPLHIALNASASSLSAYVAITQGFFAEQGLEVTHEIQPNITLIPDQLGRQVDIGFGVGPITINAASQGLDIAVISGNDVQNEDVGGVAVVVSSDIESIADLVGRTIGAPTLAGNVHLATQEWLDQNGVDPADVNFVQVPPPDMMAQLQGGVIDGVEALEPTVTAATSAGFVSLGDPQLAVAPETVGSYWIATRTWALENGDVIQRYRTALDNANAWILENPDEAYDQIVELTGFPIEAARTIVLNQFSTAVTPENLQVWGDLMTKWGGFTGEVDYEALVITGE
jgi:NitT/TauT family transport system substrate-binding protein